MTSSGLFYIQPAADKRSKRDRKQDAKAADNGLQDLYDHHFLVQQIQQPKHISKEQKNRIFESFYRADTARNTEGFGLGLSQVMKIAKYYGGTVQVDSEVGKGSTFTFIIPVNNG